MDVFRYVNYAKFDYGIYLGDAIARDNHKEMIALVDVVKEMNLLTTVDDMVNYSI